MDTFGTLKNEEWHMDPAAAAVVRRMMEERVSKKNIPLQPSTKIKVLAAVAYILCHPEEYLDDNNRLRTSYGSLLARLTGCSPYKVSTAIGMSQRLGLHVSHKSPKGAPCIAGTYWTVEIVVPPKKEGDLTAD